jgi:hypothetical protein
MRNVPLVEVACDKVGRKLVELAVDIPFATTNVDHVPDLRFAPDAIQYPQHPALTGAIGRQKKLIVHAPLTLIREVVYMPPTRKNRRITLGLKARKLVRPNRHIKLGPKETG